MELTNGSGREPLQRLRGYSEGIHHFLTQGAKTSGRAVFFFELTGQLKPEQAWIIAPVDWPYAFRRDVWVRDLAGLVWRCN